MLPGIGIFGTDPVIRIIVPYLQMNGFQVEAVWGLTILDAQSTAKDLKIPFATNKIDDVLLKKDVGLVVIFCPPNLHSQIAVKALGIGKHVLCDRPAGLTQCETLKMVRAAQYYPSLIGVLNHPIRFHPAFIEMKKNLAQFVGSPQLCSCRIEMGPILSPKFNWLCDDVMGGGILFAFGSHLIDLVTYLTNQKAVRVHGVTRTMVAKTPQINGTRRITSPDFAAIEMEMDDGMLVSITLTNHMQKGYFSQEVLISGSKGYLKSTGTRLIGHVTSGSGEGSHPVQGRETLLYTEGSDDPQSAVVFDAPHGTSATSPLLPPIYMKGLFRLLGSLREAFNVKNRESWIEETSIGQLGATFETGLYLQAVIEAIRKSSKDNKWTKVVIMTEEPDPNPALTAAVRTSTISI